MAFWVYPQQGKNATKYILNENKNKKIRFQNVKASHSEI